MTTLTLSQFDFIDKAGGSKHIFVRSDGEAFDQNMNPLSTFISSGYIASNLSKNVITRIHQIIAIKMILNPLNKPVVDHINGNKRDNRIENLRWATLAENKANSTKELSTRNKSGYTGVFWNKKRKGWDAILKKVTIGTYDTKQEASDAYKKSHKATYGEFSPF